MAIRVPINPQTRVPQGQLGYQRPADISSGTKALGNVVRAYGEYVEEQDRKRELFDVQKLLVDEANALQTDFDEKTQVEKLGAPAFTQRIEGQYNTRHQEMVAELKARGYSENAVNEFASRLGTIRGQFVAKAIDFQDKSRFAKIGSDINTLATGISQYVTNNPGGIVSGLAEMRTALQSSDLNEIEQEQIYELNKGVILEGARKGFSFQNPEMVIQLFDPESLKPKVVPTGEAVDIGEPQQVVSTELANAGYSPNVVAGFLGNFEVEGGYTGKTGDGGNAEGIAQWNKKHSPDRVANFERIIGKPISEASVAEQSKFAIWEMQNPKKAGMTVAQRDAILAAKTPEEAAELIDKHYERSDGTAREKRKTAAKAFAQTLAHADQTTEVLTQTSTPKVDETGKTGIPIIDLSTGPERMQMLAWAKQATAESDADFKAQVGVTHDNAVTAYIATGEYAGQKPTEADYIRAYGPVIGPQKLGELNEAAEVGGNIQQFKTLPNSEIDAKVEALRPKDTSSPTYATELQAYSKAVDAANNIKTARAQNPAETLFTTFPTLGNKLVNAKTPEQRKAAYAAVNEAYKKIGVPQEGRYMLTKEQAAKLQGDYAALSPEQKIGQLEEWNNELGELRVPFLRQLNKDGYGAGADSMIWMHLRNHPNDRSIMAQILAGQNIIKEDPSRRPGSDVINSNFKDTVGSALSMLNPSASKIFNDAAAAIYVANGGRTDSQLFDRDLYKNSLRKAVGGLPGQDNSGIVDMTQGEVKDYTLLPQGETEGSFRNWVEQLQPRQLTRMSVEKLPPVYRSGRETPLQDIIDEGVFVAVAPNHYIIKMASDGLPLKTATGQNFIVRIVPKGIR